MDNNPVSSKGTRHINVQHHIITDGVLENKIDIIYSTQGKTVNTQTC